MWDDNETAQPPSFVSNSTSNGYSIGKGRGLSTMSSIGGALPTPGGFNSASSKTNDDCGWNEDQPATKYSSDSWNNNNNSSSNWNNNRGGGDKSSGGGGSGRGCFKCGEEGHMSRDCPSGGGGRGGGGGGGRGCFKCGEEGHMSRDCPSGGGGGGGGRGCFKCGEEGHMSRDCPSGGGGGGGRACFKCGEEGHMSRECPSGGGGGGGGRGCFKCGEEGHMSRECPSGGGGGGGGGGGRGCFKCGEEGHMSRECPSSSSGGGGGGGGRGCFKCGEEGHMSRDCPSGGGSSGGGGGRKGCFKCGEEGHMSRDCPQSEGGDGAPKSRACFKCNEEGHMAKDCTNEDKRTGQDGKPRSVYIPPDPSEDASEIFQSVSAGIHFSKYESIPVDVTGRQVPKAISTFENAGLSNLLLDNIKKSGYKVPTPVQKNAIPIIREKRDLMACAETGSGKTAAFLLPMLHQMITDPNLPNNSNNAVQEPLAIILSPTRELAIQIWSEARKFAYDSVVKAEVVYGGTSTRHQSSKILKGIHILVATPGRLNDFIEKGLVSLAKVKYFVLDEADRMLDMGFMPAVEKMVEAMPDKENRQTLMFSATFAEEIQRLAGKFLNDYIFLTIGTVGGANTDVEQTFYNLSQFDKREKLMEILKETGTDRILVFVEQKRTADFLASFTSQNNIPTTSIHGDRLQNEREEALKDFRKGKMPVLVATAVAARGLDIKDVCLVVNYDLPQSIDEYVHRIGRTGRVGNLGKACSFYDPSCDQPLARSLKKILMDANQVIPDWLHEEASQAIGTAPQYSRGNFGGRDVRNQGGRGRETANNAWDNQPAANNYSTPVGADESWD